ncbi:cytochrome c-type biogenesis protein CcmH [Limimonas halophila]|uniref:Cytochrome c-type biogenesis protein n=1 Tax=Limimonas halophila TaxID=1082479 RepID=A0A1G7MGY1_9PROT|nr:cytochrome c-type biogenesis protein [Limimonas halophila]SDF60943.1 cytochrome c-type biogenesis protein CcmH [Limimonas halophila]
MRRALATLVMLLALSMSPAVPATTQLDTAAERERARELFQQLRCMVCQNEPIATSNAELARDMRDLVRERVAAGESNAEIKAYLTKRYGDYVLLDPPVKPSTYALWYGPAVLLLIGAAGVVVYFLRARRMPAETGGLTDAERARLDALLADDTPDRGETGRDDRES